MNHDDLIARLRENEIYQDLHGVAADAIAALVAEQDELKTVMLAAAEEIAAHWDAHCDAEGYGPQNLLRRLEKGMPTEYGYKAGAFATLKAERDALRAALLGISLCSQNSMSDKRDCGRIARAALAAAQEKP